MSFIEIRTLPTFDGSTLNPKRSTIHYYYVALLKNDGQL